MEGGWRVFLRPCLERSNRHRVLNINYLCQVFHAEMQGSVVDGVVGVHGSIVPLDHTVELWNRHISITRAEAASGVTMPERF